MKIYRYKMALLALIALGFIACSKSRNRKSTFYIDGKKYETRKFEAYMTNGRSDIVFFDNIYGQYTKVSFGFNLPNFPEDGYFEIRRSNQVPSSLLSIVIDTVIYRISLYNISGVSAVGENGLAKYTIEPTWLYNQIPDPNSNGYLQGNDSIRFWGTIYEAKDKSMR